MVKRSESALAAARAKLDKNGAKADDKIHSWYVDPATNSVVVTAAPGLRRRRRSSPNRAGPGPSR